LESRYLFFPFASLFYDVAPDGKRFLMIKQGDGALETTQASLVIVQNWFEELKRRVPVN
jgi:hypothetical protein